MVMRGMAGFSLKCESCGHEDAVMFNEMRDHLKLMAFKIKPTKKCPICGGKMKVDPRKVIQF
jgi:rRNA maturation endonuclease Nob1